MLSWRGAIDRGAMDVDGFLMLHLRDDVGITPGASRKNAIP
jgi:hypothetical protein